MNREHIEQHKQEIVDRFGPWTNHNIHLGDNLYTIAPSLSGAEVKVRRFVQVVADLVGKPFSQLRILDLACLEGLYGIEFALQGARVVGIEGRESNLVKARFAREVLGLEHIEFVQDDVRNLSVEKYGTFDVVLCLGIFYHLDAPDVFEFADRIYQTCQTLTIFDTHVSMMAEQSYLYRSQVYWGRDYVEDDTAWGSIGNDKSVWLTRPALYQLLADVGFSSVYECHFPTIPKFETMRQEKVADRSTFVALKKQPIQLKSTQILNYQHQERLSEPSSQVNS
jgi:Methyltransferase domain